MNHKNFENKIKIWSNIGCRAAFGLHALDIAEENEKLFIITSDVSTSAGLDRFRKKFPEKYLDVGISEQNMMGVASGISSEGFDVITTTFSPFQVLRCAEQIKVNLGYMRNKITMIGLASGLSLGTLGFTHVSIEDIGVLRSIPNIAIVSPADAFETIKSIRAALNYKNSIYIRLTGSIPSPIIYNQDYNFEIGKAQYLKKEGHILIISNGAMIKKSLNVSEYFEKLGIKVAVINMHTIKPIDKNILDEAIKNYEKIYTLEEHNIIGGLGSAVSEYISNKKESLYLYKFGINDRYLKSGSYNYLIKEYGIDENSVISKIKKDIKINE